MGNPVVHALAFIAAVLIPGGLLVYFAWRATRKSISPKGQPNHTAQKEGFEPIPDGYEVTPDEALDAFLGMYPKYSRDSLRAQSRARQLQLKKSRPRKKSQ
jgi:hypothetical protein